jgi:amino acid transporter
MNDDSAQFCAKCGANLRTGTFESRRAERRRAEHECFGLPHGGAIVGIAIGIIILLWGLFALAQETKLITYTINLFYVAIIVIGILIIAGAAYRISRQRPPPP